MPIEENFFARVHQRLQGIRSELCTGAIDKLDEALGTNVSKSAMNGYRLEVDCDSGLAMQ